MKKSLIAAGAASAVLAAMPVLGVFADADPILTVKDKLTVTVSSSCTMDAVNPSGANWTTGNEYTASGAAGALLNFTATSQATSFTVKCNDADGYTITPTFTDLKIGGLEAPANAAQDIPYAASSSAGSKTWTAFYSKNNGAATAFAASGTAVTGSATMSDTYAFSYSVGLGADQAAGTYVGTATYVLAAA